MLTDSKTNLNSVTVHCRRQRKCLVLNYIDLYFYVSPVRVERDVRPQYSYMQPLCFCKRIIYKLRTTQYAVCSVEYIALTRPSD